MAITSAHRAPSAADAPPGAPRRSGLRPSWASRARPPRAAPARAPALAEARTWAAAVSHHRFRRTRSPSGWMLASIDSPHGDQAEVGGDGDPVVLPCVGGHDHGDAGRGETAHPGRALPVR